MDTLKKILITTRKELSDYFASPAALLFLGIFATASLFIFFWVESFFSRNIADMRPLFLWMPILLIFLTAALTMRSWAEERRNGTIEIILTSPTAPIIQILGKYFAVLLLIIIALALTFFLPITVNSLGDLDWGPVVGGYIASIFLASAYIAIGLWSSARTDNQIVSLILAVSIAGALYAIGSQTFTNIFDYKVADFLRSLGSGSRFESITRGVLDIRDILYYLTITFIFLFFNRLTLEKLRWAGNNPNQLHYKWHIRAIKLVLLLLVINIGLSITTKARLDLTQGQIYSLSSATKQYLKELDKPLLIRGYFSATTHPLLSPLIPRVRDLLTEYAIAGGKKVRVEFINPYDNPKFEEEAGTKYGVRPVSFQTSSKYQASVVNTYFDILIEYEGQYEVLGYKDLVELKSSASGYEVELKSPEYDISRTIRTTIAKSKREIPQLDKLSRSYAVTGYISSDANLPSEHRIAKNVIRETISELFDESQGNIDLLFIDPDADDITGEYLTDKLHVRPLGSNMPDSKPYWFYLSISDGKKSVPIILPDKYSKDTLRTSIIFAIKRLLPDSTKTVALLTPTAAPGPSGIISSQVNSKKFNIMREILRESVRVVDLKLENGKVSESVDFLMVLAPRYLDPTFESAIEDFLIRGGTVLVATAPIDASVGNVAEVNEIESGLEKLFAKYGIKLQKELVLDKQNGVLPIPSPRRVGSLVLRETKIVDYPYIVDIRDKGLNQNSVITSRLGQIYLPWAAPIDIDVDKNINRKVIPLLKSSADSWLSDSLDILPDFEKYPELGFQVDNDSMGSQNLAVMIEGDFDSKTQESTNEDPTKLSRLILVGSGSLFTDNFSDLMTQALLTEYRRPAQFMQNLVDWSVEDQNMLSVLRKHSHFTRTLETLDNDEKKLWEYLNYGFVIIGLIIIFAIKNFYQKRVAKQNKLILYGTSAQ